MTSTISPVVLRFAPMLDSPSDVCIKVDGKLLFAYSEMLCRQSTVWASGLSAVWKEPKGAASEAPGSSGSDKPVGVSVQSIKITKYSYEVVRSAMFWIMTDYIGFSDGQDGPRVAPDPTSRLPTPVPAFQMYRFAQFYDIQGLSEVALNAIKDNFKTGTILGKLFEDCVGKYPHVKSSMMDFVVEHWEEVQREEEYGNLFKR